jgi:hypothetical protein
MTRAAASLRSAADFAPVLVVVCVTLFDSIRNDLQFNDTADAQVVSRQPRTPTNVSSHQVMRIACAASECRTIM